MAALRIERSMVMQLFKFQIVWFALLMPINCKTKTNAPNTIKAVGISKRNKSIYPLC